MKIIFVVFVGLISCSYFHKVECSGEKYWKDYTEKLLIVKKGPISAIGVAGNHLYIAAVNKLFISNLDGTSLVDVTNKIKKEPEDEITDILVDSSEKTLYFAINNNVYPALSYSYALDSKHSDRSYLKRLVELAEYLGAHSPPHTSVYTLAFDNSKAIIGFFKGSVYLYSFKNKTYKLMYKPTSNYNWPVATVLNDDTAFVAVPGDGLITVRINGNKINVSRYHDSENQHIKSLAIQNQELYISSENEVYKTNIQKFY